jgi:hypothetical protein
VRQPFAVRFRYDPDEPVPGRLAILHDDGRAVRVIGGKIDGASRTVRVESVDFGTFCLARLETPPAITQVRRLRDGRVAFRAQGPCGHDTASCPQDFDEVQVWQGDERAIVDFNARSGEGTAEFLGHDTALAPPNSDLAIIVRDRAGNVARWFGSAEP